MYVLMRASSAGRDHVRAYIGRNKMISSGITLLLRLGIACTESPHDYYAYLSTVLHPANMHLNADPIKAFFDKIYPI